MGDRQEGEIGGAKSGIDGSQVGSDSPKGGVDKPLKPRKRGNGKRGPDKKPRARKNHAVSAEKLTETERAKLTPKQRAERLALLEEKLRVAEASLTEVIDSDPFWFFEPNTGDITPERRALLARYLKEEDIPTFVDSQLDALLCRSGIKGVSGGNRSSKTVCGTIDGIIKSTGELPKSMEQYKDIFADVIERANRKFIKGRVTAVDNKQLHRVVLDAWKKWIPREYLKKGIWEESYSKEFDILTLYRKGKPCSQVEFLTNQQDVKSAQGGDLDWAKFDEEPAKAKWKETLMRFGTAEALDIEIDWTPTEGLTWATELFHDGIFEDEQTGNETEIKDSTLFKLTTVTNSHINLDTQAKIMDEYVKVSSYEEMKMRLLGEAISLSGLVYSGLFAKHHVMPPFIDDLSPSGKQDYLCIAGFDPHLVTATAGVFVLVDREGIMYVDRCYSRDADTEEVKEDFHRIVRESGYRMGWSVADKSSNSTITAFGGRNIFRELSRGKNAIPGLRTSDKFEGSIKAGVDDIKKRLRASPPRIYIVDRPENKVLINSFRTLERDTYANEDSQGPKDRIKEGKHHLHASLRYVTQFPVSWYPLVQSAPEPEFFDEAALW